MSIGEDVTIIGYGRPEKNILGGLLKAATTPVYRVTENGFYTGGEGLPDICKGDSGGPVYNGQYIVGINSGTIKMCDYSYHVATYNFIDWIENSYKEMLLEHEIEFDDNIDLTSGYCEFSDVEYFIDVSGFSCSINLQQRNNYWFLLIIFMFAIGLDRRRNRWYNAS